MQRKLIFEYCLYSKFGYSVIHTNHYNLSLSLYVNYNCLLSELQEVGTVICIVFIRKKKKQISDF